MSEYFDDFLLVVSMIGAPIILGTLLFYGASERKRHNAKNDQPADETKTVYAAEEPKRAIQEKRAQTPSRPPDIMKRKTGTGG